MKYYEILYIVNPNFEPNRLDQIKQEVGSEVQKLLSATIINHRYWGKKRLAYPIEKHKYGIYVLLHCETPDSTRLDEFKTWFRLHKAIIRELIVRLDTRPAEDLSPEGDANDDDPGGEPGTGGDKRSEEKSEPAGRKQPEEPATSGETAAVDISGPPEPAGQDS